MSTSQWARQLRFGIAHFNRGRYAQALVCFDAARRSKPDDPTIALFTAHALRSLGRTRTSLAVLRGLKRGHPADGAADLCEGDLLAAEGKHGAAATAYRRVARRHSNDVQPRLRLGRLAFLRREFGAARSHYLAALRLDARSVEGRLGLWSSHFMRGEFREAAEQAEKLLDLDRSQHTLDCLMAPLSNFPSHRQRALWTRVQRKLADYLRRRPRDPWAALACAYCLLENKRGDEALAATSSMAAFPKRYQWMRYIRGKLFLFYGRDYQAAQREFAASLRSAPRLWKAKAFLAETALCRGDSRRAMSILRRVIDRVPASEIPQARTWRGEILLWMGRLRDAIGDLDAGVEGGMMFARYWRGGAYLKLGRLRRALADLDAYVPTNLQDAEALTWRGEANRRLGRWKEAADDLGRALRLDPINPWALANLALVKAATGDEAGMRRDFRRLPPEVLGYLRGLRVKRGAARCEERLLRALLDARHGVRIAQSYLYPLWMRGGGES